MRHEAYHSAEGASAGARRGSRATSRPGSATGVAPPEDSRELVMWSMDADGTVLDASGAWGTMLGWRPEDVVRSHMTRLLHPADFARVRAELKALDRSPRALPDLHGRFRMPSGDYRALTWMAIGSVEEGIVGLAWEGPAETGHQATGHHAIEWLGRRNAQLQRQVEAYEHEVATMEGLIAAVAHELAEPLLVAESCMTSVEAALAETLDDETRESIAVVSRVSARGRVLIDTLLADARTASQGLVTQKVDSAELACEALELFGARIRARSADVRIEALPTLDADPGLLAVVFQNLLANALIYGPRERGRIRIAADREDDYWRFRVTSGGMPLRPEDVERIFLPFQRIPGERRARGAGLGLSICRRIVERHGGRIGATPEPGVGNTFWFTLPA